MGTAKRTFFVEVTNRPVCAAKEASRHCLMAQPPRLGKAGNVISGHYAHAGALNGPLAVFAGNAILTVFCT
jgi:hypothetical protein